MELFIALQDGLGDGVLAQPAAIVEVAENWEPEKLSVYGKATFRENDRSSYFVQGDYQWHPQVKFYANAQSTPGEVGDWEREFTFQVGAELNMDYVTFTGDVSPNAFGVGKRARFGVKSDYQFTPRVSATAATRMRYLSQFDNWKPQAEVAVHYKLNDTARISLQYQEYDYFESATTLAYRVRAF